MSENIFAIEKILFSGNFRDHDLIGLSGTHLEKILANLVAVFSRVQSTVNDEFSNLCCCCTKDKFNPEDVPERNTYSQKYIRFLKNAIRNFYRLYMQLPHNIMDRREKRKAARTAAVPDFKQVPYVKVCDIIHQKKYFLGAMNLVPSAQRPEEKIKNCDIRTKTYRPSVPFSSDLGRMYMRNPRYHMTDYLRTRKESYTNNFLTSKSSVAPLQQTYPITFNKKARCDHVYNFPKRTNSQNNQYLDLLTQALCKPVSVSLRKQDLSGFSKRCVVVVERMDITKYL